MFPSATSRAPATSSDTTVVVVEPAGLEECSAPLAAQLAQTLPDLRLRTCSGYRRAVKAWRREADAGLILALVDERSLGDLRGLCHAVRRVMHDHVVRIIVWRVGDLSLSDLELITEHGVDAVIEDGPELARRLSAQLSSQLRTWRSFRTGQSQREAQGELLASLARFSRLELDVSECIEQFTRCVGSLTGALLANAIMVDQDGGSRRSHAVHLGPGVDPETGRRLLEIDPAPDSTAVRTAVTDGRTQVCLDADDPRHHACSELVGTDVGASLAFAVRSFGRTVCVVECFLPGSGLAGISVDLVQLVERASEQLGVMVERRDAEHELKRQYDRLHTTLNELATTREALYHSEKLASIGQLAAGIAHEINNPVAYVLSNFGPLDEYVACMSRMLGLHGRFVAALDQRDAGACDHARSSLEALGREVDLDFVLEDVRSLVTESRQGLLRVKEIVTNLNEFSRRDDVEQAPADINQGLESTLKLLAPKLKSGITVERDLAALPLVRCNLGLLNQVFLNVLQNACMAMEGRGRIRIATRAEGEDVVVAIRDDGPGMPESVRQRIFEPFFTTKPVGEGTGLGLSLCHGIVSRHGGRIEVDTSPGEGTEFRIVVPVSGARKAA